MRQGHTRVEHRIDEAGWRTGCWKSGQVSAVPVGSRRLHHLLAGAARQADTPQVESLTHETQLIE